MEKKQPHSLQGAPTQKGSKEETFAALAFTYGFTDEVATFLLKGPMENLEDFSYYFADEDEIDAFMKAIWKPKHRHHWSQNQSQRRHQRRHSIAGN